MIVAIDAATAGCGDLGRMQKVFPFTADSDRLSRPARALSDGDIVADA